MSPSIKIFLGIAVCLWMACGSALTSRIQLVFDYSTLPSVPPAYEVFAAPTSAMIALLGVLLVVCWPMFFAARTPRDQRQPASFLGRWSEVIAAGAWLIASFPLWLMVLRINGTAVPPPGWWELVWFAGWTGFGVRQTLRWCEPGWSERRWNMPVWLSFGGLALLMVACGAWWYWQSVSYYRDFQLGFNDFGHFTQRISNTASGRGFLLESPVLPPFWDHFNPGLTLLVPLWKWFPSVELVFVIQAACLAGSAGLIAWIAWCRGHSSLSACVWGFAWLLFPAVGQMNLAYTYGWHPITLAIPCLLAAYLAVQSHRYGLGIALAVLAASFEEGVLVVIACYATAEGLRCWWESRNATARTWGIVASVSVVLFFIVYQFSGLAPFQTGRFARLGNNAFEIVLSPLLRPQEFWGLLLRPRNFAYASLLLGPFLVVSRGRRMGAWWSVLPPMLVLMVWEHMPAQSIAFQYASCLIPILFIDAMGESALGERTELALHPSEELSRACALLAVGWVLSICVGQMPWSRESLLDVRARTYGGDLQWTRSHQGKDGLRVDAWIQELRAPERSKTESSFPEWDRLRVLATGRIAAHCVGAADVETVGQFWQRYEALQKLDPELPSPILRYDVILLDFKESFQQSTEETQRLLSEAQQHGWTIHDQAYDMAILRRNIAPANEP